MQNNHYCGQCSQPLTVKEITEQMTECVACKLGFQPTMRGLASAMNDRTQYDYWVNGRLVRS